MCVTENYLFNFLGSILHEMLHAMGFSHEQNRVDRDQYITINTDNIRPGMYTRFFYKESL